MTADPFAAHLSVHAGRYFPELAGAPVEARCVARSVRPVSVLYRFRLESGPEGREVVVKAPVGAPVPARQGAGEELSARPRLAPFLPPEERFLSEYRSLAAVHDHVQRLGDPRLGAVRVLDLLSTHRAFVMEAVGGESLRALLYRSHRGRRPAAGDVLETAFRNTGAWLRAYHALGPQEGEEPRHARRADYVDFVERLAEFLGARLGDPGFFRRIGSSFASTARMALPERLPLGMGHGDFALRNVLVGGGGRVTVLDTLARYRTPIYADLGYFLVSLRHNWPQVFSLGAALPAARLASCESAFLAGYFAGEPVPRRALRLYELQALLDLWAEVASRRGFAEGWWRGLERSARLTALSRCLRRRIATEVSG